MLHPLSRRASINSKQASDDRPRYLFTNGKTSPLNLGWVANRNFLAEVGHPPHVRGRRPGHFRIDGKRHNHKTSYRQTDYDLAVSIASPCRKTSETNAIMPLPVSRPTADSTVAGAKFQQLG